MALTPEQQIARMIAIATAQGWPQKRIDEEVAKMRRSSEPAKPRGNQPSKRIALDQAYVVAPYRFTQLNKVVVLPELEIGRGLERGDLHSQPLGDGFSGRLTLSWEAETPLLIGDVPENTKDKDSKDKDVVVPLQVGDDFWIPGATIRGMVRAACETVSHARLGPINDHHVFPNRDFGHSGYAEDSPVSKEAEIKVGWLKRTGKIDRETGLHQHQLECWGHGALRYIAIDDLVRSSAMVTPTDHETWRERIALLERYRSIGRTTGTGKGERPRFDLAKPLQFREVNRPQPQGKNIKFFIVDATRGTEAGHLVFSNKSVRGSSNNLRARKKVEYVFLEPETRPSPVVFKPEEFQRFHLIHTSYSRNRREPEGSYAVLEPALKAGEEIPVFYVGEPGQEGFAFGLTRAFKIPHKFSVGQKLADTPHERRNDLDDRIDMAEALFGYVRDGMKDETGRNRTALKSRVDFSGGVISKTNTQSPQISEAIETVMMGPKASFAPFYLAGDIKDWSDPDSKLAGRKRYLPRTAQADLPNALQAIRKRLEHQVKALSAEVQNKPAIKTKLKLLHGGGKPLSFTTDIDFHNVTAAELGLVLFSLTFGTGKAGQGTHRHMIGRARPFGAGQLRLAGMSQQLMGHSAQGETLLAQPDWAEQLVEMFCQSMRDAPVSHRLLVGSKGDGWLPYFPEVPVVEEWLVLSDIAAGAKLPDPVKPAQPSIQNPDPARDNYLRLRYFEPDERTGEMKGQNPYQKLRNATKLLANDGGSRPKGHPDRLLRG